MSHVVACRVPVSHHGRTFVGVGDRGKLELQERARSLRAAGWTVPDIAAEIDAMDRRGVERLGTLGDQAFLAAGAALSAKARSGMAGWASPTPIPT
jgi:hypothetical protein